MAKRHGGRREGAGRKPELGETRTVRLELKLAESELAELLGAAGDTKLATWVREAALTAARKT